MWIMQTRVLGENLTWQRRPLVICDIIALLDDVQGKLDTSQRDVEKGHDVNNSIQATLGSLKETRGHGHQET